MGPGHRMEPAPRGGSSGARTAGQTVETLTAGSFPLGGCAGSPVGCCLDDWGDVDGPARPVDNGVMTDRLLRVVLAEDSVILRDGMVELLGARGCDVVATAGTAGELLAAVAAHHPDVAVVDVRMPPTFSDPRLAQRRGGSTSTCSLSCHP